LEGSKTNVKILFLLRSLNIGGTERQLEMLAKGLCERGHAVVVTSFYAGGPIHQALQDAGIRVHALHKRGRWDLLAFLVRLAKFIRQERPDILHGYLHEPNNISVFLKLFFPRMKIVWGVRSSVGGMRQNDIGAGLSFRLSRRLSIFADAIIVNSQAGRDYYVAMGYPAEKIVKIPNGIDTEQFSFDPMAREQLRFEWGVTAQQKLIGLVGRLDPIKDHQTFLKAAALLIEKNSDVRFVCVGDGPAGYKASLKDLTEALGILPYVNWIDARPNIAPIYSALDILVSSSSVEGFSNVLGEAMSCGVPCVATNVGDSAQLLAELGAIVPTKDARGLMVEIERLLSDCKQAARMRKRIVDHFSVKTLVCNTEDLLKRLAASSVQ
jgi:glycosyltransferase involved in cell wall biosynthesis